MRPPKHRGSHFLQPLDEILAAPAHVRLLRVLALRRTALTAGELAKSALLTRTSIYPVLRQLERAGIVEFVGAGSRKLVQLRSRHALSRILRDLFHTEAQQFEELTATLRKCFSHLPHRPLSAWVGDTNDVSSGDTLSLYVVAGPEELEQITDYLNAHLAAIERKYDVQIAVRGLTRSELDTLPNTRLQTLNPVLIAGVPPAALTARSRSAARESTFVSHHAHDARARRLALAIAAKIRRDPGLIAIAEDHVKQRAQLAGAGERRELMEWARILSTMSPARLQRFLVEDSERAVRLRQTLPTLNILSPAEREAVVQSHTDADVIAAITQR